VSNVLSAETAKKGSKRKRGKAMGWIENAVQKVRDFAYTPVMPGSPEASTPGRRPRVGVALGGGFARGIAHLGVLHALQEHNIPIDCIAGTSAGALAGLAYSCGRPFEEVVQKASLIRFGNFGQWRISKMGLASNQRLEKYPEKFLGVKTFDDLTVPVSIAATDLVTGEAVYFTAGPLGPPLRASCAYPGLFQPVEYDGRMLVDGFVSAAVPVDAARMMGAEVVIAVFLEAESLEKPANLVDVIGRSFSIVRLQADVGWRLKSDIVITPPVREFAWDDFARTKDLVAAGESSALEALPQIQAALRPVVVQAQPS
jgi:NTE family protein